MLVAGTYLYRSPVTVTDYKCCIARETDTPRPLTLASDIFTERSSPVISPWTFAPGHSLHVHISPGLSLWTFPLDVPAVISPWTFPLDIPLHVHITTGRSSPVISPCTFPLHIHISTGRPRGYFSLEISPAHSPARSHYHWTSPSYSTPPVATT